MTDSTLNRFLSSGTNAERVAFTPSPPTPASGNSPGYFFYETDTGNSYSWDGAAWQQVNSAGTLNALTDVIITAAAQGDVLYFDGTDWVNLGHGTAGQVLTTQGAGANPSWADAAGGSVWTLAGTGQTATGVWDFAVDGAKANVDFAGLGSFSEVLLIAKGVTKAVSALLSVQASVDNGANFFSGSTDYAFITIAGVETTNGFLADFHSTGTTAARSGVVHIPMININGAPKVTNDITQGTGVSRIFLASTSPINALRCLSQSGGNLTGGKIYCLAR